jgi:hypothetical protein
MDEEVRILSIQCLKYLKGYLHAVKSYDMGPSRFTTHPKEGVLRIFIALKNPSPWPGLNPRPLGPVASTLTTTPPRPHGYICTRVFPSQLLNNLTGFHKI